VVRFRPWAPLFFEGNFFAFSKINYTAFIREKSKF